MNREYWLTRVLLVLAFLGILLYGATVVIEQRFTGWAFRGQNR